MYIGIIVFQITGIRCYDIILRFIAVLRFSDIHRRTTVHRVYNTALKPVSDFNAVNPKNDMSDDATSKTVQFYTVKYSCTPPLDFSRTQSILALVVAVSAIYRDHCLYSFSFTTKTFKVQREVVMRTSI